MSSPIERFKDSYQNWRYNPFTAADMAVDKEEDGLIIPSGSPFLIQLLEQARYNDPTSVVVRCYGVDTFVDETSASGQPILKVDDTAGFSPADTIIINRGGAREEERIIDTIQAGISLTVTVNLTYEHTAGQADVVEKYIAFTETAGAPAQSQFRVDYPPGDGGEGTGLVEFNTNDADKEIRINYKATGSPALAETLDTKISYPAGTPADDRFIGFSSGAPIWRQFSHNNLVGVTTDQHHAKAHVLSGADHTASGLTVGHVIRASGAAAFAWAQLQHGDLGGVTANQHHAQVHTLVSHSDFSSYLNQAVKTTSTPSFSKLNLTHSSSKLQGGTGLYLEAGGDGIRSQTIKEDTTVAGANMYVDHTTYRIMKSTSALKHKDKVKDLELDPSLIHKLRVVSFNSKCETDDKGKRFIGLIADDVEKILPEIVLYNEKGKAEGYDNQMLLVLAIAELQKLKKQMTN